MTPQAEKVEQFLNQFGHEDEFIAWCEGQGVKGVPWMGAQCLLSEAVHRATGLTGIYVGYVDKDSRVSVDHQVSVRVPAPISAVPLKFDMGKWPDLDRTRAV